MTDQFDPRYFLGSRRADNPGVRKKSRYIDHLQKEELAEHSPTDLPTWQCFWMHWKWLM
ncbi:MAG: hypothetical protein U5N86_10805 [Planctomycetota bacterium]|nr:hypothetical protein [Planctomycetota bacterium]